jgi:hypothetical protein
VAFDGELVKFEPMMQHDAVAQTDSETSPPIIVGGAFPHAARRAIACGDGWIPIGGRSADPLEVLPQFRQMAKDAGRDPASLSFDVFGAPRDLEVLKRYRDAGADRVVLMLPPKPRDAILPILDEGTALVTALWNRAFASDHFFPQWAQRADGFDPAPPAWHLIQGRFIRIDVSGLLSRICMLFRVAESTT